MITNRFSRLFLLLSTLWLSCQMISKPPESDATSEFQGPELQHVVSPRIPARLRFAGEEVPLDNPTVRERLEQELTANMYFHTSTLMLLKQDRRWRKVIQDLLNQNGVPEDFYYLAIAESRLDNLAVSPAGAMGMWQFMKTTAGEYGLEVGKHVDERKDPFTSTQAAARYLVKSHEKFGNWTAVAASFNRGMAGLERAMEGQKTRSYYDLYLNTETYRYVFRVLALKVILEDPETYGYHVTTDEKYAPWTFREVEITETITDLPAFAIAQGITYGELKRLNPWLDSATYELPVVSGKKYMIRLPA
jgi:membrane-bound lytic murein transglycosylase D